MPTRYQCVIRVLSRFDSILPSLANTHQLIARHKTLSPDTFPTSARFNLSRPGEFPILGKNIVLDVVSPAVDIVVMFDSSLWVLGLDKVSLAQSEKDRVIPHGGHPCKGVWGRGIKWQVVGSEALMIMISYCPESSIRCPYPKNGPEECICDAKPSKQESLI